MATSGTTAIATIDDNPVTLLSAAEQNGLRCLVMINEGAVPGFFSIDAGQTWNRWPSGASFIELSPALLSSGKSIQFKRAPGGTNATGLYAWGY